MHTLFPLGKLLATTLRDETRYLLETWPWGSLPCVILPRFLAEMLVLSHAPTNITKFGRRILDIPLHLMNFSGPGWWFFLSLYSSDPQNSLELSKNGVFSQTECWTFPIPETKLLESVFAWLRYWPFLIIQDFSKYYVTDGTVTGTRPIKSEASIAFRWNEPQTERNITLYRRSCLWLYQSCKYQDKQDEFGWPHSDTSLGIVCKWIL